MRGFAVRSALAPLVVCGLAASSLFGCAGETSQVAVSTAELRTLTEVTSFGTNPGNLQMFTHTPSNLPAGPRPLLVALHGCAMSASGYADAGWNDLADERGILVVYPQQRSANNSTSCFNWGGSWDSSNRLRLEDIRRGGDEVSSIIEMVMHMQSMHDIDASRIYVTGLSAGAGMTAVLLASYPDVFAAGAIMAGIPYGCATTTTEAYSCMNLGSNASLQKMPDAWAALVGTAHAGYSGPRPRVSIWHGSSDFIVNPQGSVELMEQWTAVHGIDQTPDGEETVGRGTRSQYNDGSGRTLVETWTVSSMGHATAIDPMAGCGSIGSYVTDVDLCAAELALDFFEEGSGPPPMGTDAGMTIPPIGGDGGVGPGPGTVDGGAAHERCTRCSISAGSAPSGLAWTSVALIGIALAFRRARARRASPRSS